MNHIITGRCNERKRVTLNTQPRAACASGVILFARLGMCVRNDDEVVYFSLRLTQYRCCESSPNDSVYCELAE